MWYHVSNEDKGDEFFITELRLPLHGYGEPVEPRFSLAPTVGRAILGCPNDAKTFFIYQVHVTAPVPTDKTMDHHITHEHIIDETVLAAERWKIRATYVGSLPMDQEVMNGMKLVYLAKKIEMTDEEEREVLWNIDTNSWTFDKSSPTNAKRLLKALRAKAGNDVADLES